MRFLITRPKSQAAKLVSMLQASQHAVQIMPVIKIKPLPNPAFAIELIKRLKDFDIAIFISANAVHQSAKLIKQYAPSFALNEYLKIAAIGPSTAKAIGEYGWHADILPTDKYDSDGLLQASELQAVTNKEIIIFRGVGGREVLYDNLSQRGANVAQAPTYERSLPTIENAILNKAFKDKPDGIVVMSNESLNNLYTLAADKYRDNLLASQLVVISQRCADLAQNLKFKNPAIIASTPDDISIFEALINTGRKHDRQ